MTLWNSNKECSHDETERATVEVYELNSARTKIDSFEVTRCTDCHSIQSVVGSENNTYQIQQNEGSDITDPENCQHKVSRQGFQGYEFEFSDGEYVWETTVRKCLDCNNLIERVIIHLEDKPKQR